MCATCKQKRQASKQASKRRAMCVPDHVRQPPRQPQPARRIHRTHVARAQPRPPPPTPTPAPLAIHRHIHQGRCRGAGLAPVPPHQVGAPRGNFPRLSRRCHHPTTSLCSSSVLVLVFFLEDEDGQFHGVRRHAHEPWLGERRCVKCCVPLLYISVVTGGEGLGILKCLPACLPACLPCSPWAWSSRKEMLEQASEQA